MVNLDKPRQPETDQDSLGQSGTDKKDIRPGQTTWHNWPTCSFAIFVMFNIWLVVEPPYFQQGISRMLMILRDAWYIAMWVTHFYTDHFLIHAMFCITILYWGVHVTCWIDITWAVDRLGKYTSIASWIILSQGRRMRLVHIQQWCGWISQLSTVYRVRLQDFDSCCLIYLLIILKYIFETETSHMSRETMEEYLQSCVRSGQPVRRIGEMGNAIVGASSPKLPLNNRLLHQCI